MDFENFYITWYSRVKHFARDYVISEEEAENITQDVFLDFYQKRDSLDFHINVVAYLFTAVKNRCIDYLRRKLLDQEATSRMQEEFDWSLRMKFDSLEAFDVDNLSEDTIKTLIV